MRSMWKGSVSFGLVTIPVALYAATENKNVSLRQVHEVDGARIKYRRFCEAEGVEVPYGEIAKGYELPDGGMVIVTDEDLAALPLPSSREIDVVEFVPWEAIDPILFDRSYYVEPQKAAVKPYVLLRDALGKSGRVAIAKVALRQRESLAVLRVVGDVLVMTTMLWPDEVRVADFGFLGEEVPQVRSQELAMAGSLIESLSEPVFEQDKYQDVYREALESLIEAKVSGEEATTPAGGGEQAEVVDLMTALQASVTAAKETRKAPAKPKRKPAAAKPAAAKTVRKAKSGPENRKAG